MIACHNSMQYSILKRLQTHTSANFISETKYFKLFQSNATRPYNAFHLVMHFCALLATLLFYLPPVFEKRREVWFWGPSPYPLSPPSLQMFVPYISVAIKASFLKLGMCNICKNNIAKMFLDFFLNLKLFI